ncbi:MAG: glycosyltransferase family 39 protein [bacterium]|nr:glycosyltransferase family 39 protein [bacterium]
MKRAAILIFSIALLTRVVFLFAFSDENSLLYHDSYTYIQAAKNLLTHGIYSMGYDVPPSPDSFRTPLYPLILLPFVKFGISWYVLAAIQAIVMSGAAVLVFLLGRRIFPEKIVFAAALMFAIEPFGALIGGQIMTESFFSLLFIVAMFNFAFYVQRAKPRDLLVGAVALAIAALLKQFALFFVVMIPFAYVLAGSRLREWRALLVPLTVFFVILSPWIIRNRLTLHTWDFSSQSGYNLYAYNAGDFSLWLQAHFPKLFAERGVALAPDDLLDVNFRYDVSRIPEIQAKAVRFIGAYPFAYGVFHVTHMPSLFTNAAYNNFFYSIPQLGFRYEDEQALYDDIGAFRFVIAAGRVAAHPVLLLALIANFFFIIVALLAIVSPFVEWRREGRIKKTTIFFVVAILLYALLSSPISGARLRIPLNPILFTLAIYSITLLCWTRKNPSPQAVPSL